jgi:hypothetical protein
MALTDPSPISNVAPLRVPRPLSARVFLARNRWRALPMAAVIALAVVLIGTVTCLLNSADLTVRLTYGYLRFFGTLVPENAIDVPEGVRKTVAADPRTGAMIRSGVSWLRVRTILGHIGIPVFGVSEEDARRLVDRCELRVVAGRLPRPGTNDVALSVEWARNLRTKVGGRVGGSAAKLRVCGLLDGPVRLALGSDTYMLAHFYPPVQIFMVLARDPAEQEALGGDLRARLKRRPVTLNTLTSALERTRVELSHLFLIANMVQTCVVLIVALTMGLLTYIYYSQRTPEFGLLAAIGYGRRRLLARVAREVILLVTGAWVLGLVLNLLTLWLLWRLMMEPRGMVLDPFDPTAYARTLVLPGIVLLFALGTITRQVWTLDPVTVIERRL